MISIVMSYYNRLPQLKFTLETILQSQHNNFEIIIVDDFSSPLHSLDSLKYTYPKLNLKIIKMKDLNLNKNYVNPCIPYNVGFRHSTGDKIIIQNPECCHIGDILTYVEENLKSNQYLSFHCFAIGKRDLSALHEKKKIDISSVNGRWYNHKIHRPFSYHFTTAINRKDLIELNGFDESYAQGFNYDDAEFVERIKKKKLEIIFVEYPNVIHQYHGKSMNNPLNPIVRQDNSLFFKNNLPTLSIRANNQENII